MEQSLPVSKGGIFIANQWIVLLFICAVACLCTYIGASSLMSDEMLQMLYGGKVSADRIEYFAAHRNELLLMTFAITPLICLLKILCVTCCLSAGLFLLNKSHRFETLLGVAVTAEIVFLIPQLTKLVWFDAIVQNYSYNDIVNFSPLSLASALDYGGYAKLWSYPLQTINIFEIIYVLVLARGIFFFGFAATYWEAIRTTSVSYGTGLFIWLLFVTFLNVSI